MQVILADMTISISEFKANPNQAVKDANGEPFCVMTNNAPAFYVVKPELWERLNDLLDDVALAPTIDSALKRRKQAVKVSLEHL
ncbi:MAG: hypothetical protein RIS82_540 [Actinomycetota bacterium]